ncbi:TMV resistance protein N-like isoform X2 [Eucalyptus grandis]|uniref:TMV resistance protein N-like isoform X2 n=1 Tax=Eucalyptus grandis TaxID=71139 RepID=UPI00192EE26F|nr:TMV resistance protein N-like isoform X2 [Eucalyptus grandis]
MGIEMIRKTLCDKKVLLILDDVDNRDQLSKLAGKSDWFGSGSRIIITTRDINFLPIKEKDKGSSFQAHSQEFQYYKMKEMDFFYALRLFSKHAFEMDLPPHDFDDISRKITTTTGGLPLAIAVIGSSLQGKSKTSWKVTLQKLKSVPNREVFNKLKFSYDMLEPEQQEIFLDISCFFIGKDILHPSYMWKASNYFPEMELLVLTRKSLIKITKDLKFWMHDQLRDLGREIVRCEDINFPENCSRLWEPEFALEVVQRKKGTQKVVALKLTRLSKSKLSQVNNFQSCPI